MISQDASSILNHIIRCLYSLTQSRLRRLVRFEILAHLCRRCLKKFLTHTIIAAVSTFSLTQSSLLYLRAFAPPPEDGLFLSS